jgi:asparagine synthase (glutamine-hydrolysing)
MSGNRNGRLLRKAHSLTTSALSDPGRAFYRTNTFIDDADLNKLLSPLMRALSRGYDPAGHTLKYWDRMRGADHVASMLYTDVKTYLPGDILVKVDRMSMAHSLEVRAPLLDHRIVEFAASLPSSWKISGRVNKQILKQAFSSYLPDLILNRRKHGFTVPLDHWFRNDLRTLGEEHLLRYAPLAAYFDPERVGELWQEHQQGRNNHGTLLWSLLSFSLWHREYLN